MDFSMLYLIIAVIAVIGIAALVINLKQRKIISQDDLMLVTQIFNLSTEIISELDIQHEAKISQISQIVVSALKYATDTSTDKTKDQIIELATNEAYNVCTQMGIELTDNRKNIISQLVQLGITSVIKLPQVDPQPEAQPEVNTTQETKTEDVVPTGLITPENNVPSESAPTTSETTPSESNTVPSESIVDNVNVVTNNDQPVQQTDAVNSDSTDVKPVENIVAENTVVDNANEVK